jgi:transposase InsO family protein
MYSLAALWAGGFEFDQNRTRTRRARAGLARSLGQGRVGTSQRQGTQYLSIRYSERLAECGIKASVGTTGDSYDNALAESIVGLYKTEVIRRRGPTGSLRNCNPGGCIFEERPERLMVNPDTGRPLTHTDACYKQGASIKYSASAAQMSRDAVKEFLLKTFGMSKPVSR